MGRKSVVVLVGGALVVGMAVGAVGGGALVGGGMWYWADQQQSPMELSKPSMDNDQMNLPIPATYEALAVSTLPHSGLEPVMEPQALEPSAVVAVDSKETESVPSQPTPVTENKTVPTKATSTKSTSISSGSATKTSNDSMKKSSSAKTTSTSTAGSGKEDDLFATPEAEIVEDLDEDRPTKKEKKTKEKKTKEKESLDWGDDELSD